MPRRDYQKCAVSGCVHRGSEENIKKCMFPANEALCAQWLHRINNPQLTDRSPKFVRKNYTVCDKHFETSAFETTERSRLNRGTQPTIFENEQSTSAVPIQGGTSVGDSDIAEKHCELQGNAKFEPQPSTYILQVLRNVYKLSSILLSHHLKLWLRLFHSQWLKNVMYVSLP